MVLEVVLAFKGLKAETGRAVAGHPKTGPWECGELLHVGILFGV